MGEWITCKLGDVLEFKRGYDLPMRDRRPGPVPIVSSAGVSDWHSEPKVKGPGVVTGRYGTLGEVHFITSDFWPLNTALYVRDFKGNDERFISYFLRILDFFAYSDKAAVPGLNRNHLHLAQVNLPPLPEQRAIASVLGSLDDKIELNRRMNRTLEAMAAAIFKAWFVDFEPVKAKAAGATTFPGMPQPTFDALPTTFTNSQLGPVPEGWEVVRLGNAARLTMGQSPKSEFYNTNGEGLPFHQGVTNYGERFPVHKTYCSVESRLAEAGDILFSVRAPVGRINVADERLIVGRGLAAIRHKREWQSYLLYALKHQFAEEDSIGDGTIFKAVNKADMEGIRLVEPNKIVGQTFEAIASAIDQQIGSNQRESRVLAETRDALLSKLLSGEVRITKFARGVA